MALERIRCRFPNDNPVLLPSQSDAFSNPLKGVSTDYHRRMLQKINAVTIEDMHRVAMRYLTGLFDPKRCITTIICHPMKAPKIAEAFKLLNHDLKIYTSLEESHLND